MRFTSSIISAMPLRSSYITRSSHKLGLWFSLGFSFFQQCASCRFCPALFPSSVARHTCSRDFHRSEQKLSLHFIFYSKCHVAAVFLLALQKKGIEIRLGKHNIRDFVGRINYETIGKFERLRGLSTRAPIHPREYTSLSYVLLLFLFLFFPILPLPPSSP